MFTRRSRRAFVGAVAAVLVAVGGVVAAAPAHAGTGGTVEATVEDAHGVPTDGVCLSIITPDKKNSPDDVITTTAGSGADGTPGHITQANVPAGSWVGKYFNCGGSVPFVPFYTGGTLNKAKATPFGVTDGGFTNIGVQLILPGGNGYAEGYVLDGNGDGVPSLSVHAYSANRKVLLDSSCSDDSGHFYSFNLPDNVGGVKLEFGAGSDCSNDSNFLTNWYGGADFTSATPIAITSDNDTVVGDVTVASPTKLSVTVTSVSFSGTSSDPVITINGSGFGKKMPAPNPSERPCGEDDVASSGYDYGNRVVFWDTSNAALWQAGYPGDCIGLILASYSTTQISFTLNDWYRDPLNNGHLLANGDQFSVRIKGVPLTGTVSGLS